MPHPQDRPLDLNILHCNTTIYSDTTLRTGHDPGPSIYARFRTNSNHTSDVGSPLYGHDPGPSIHGSTNGYDPGPPTHDSVQIIAGHDPGPPIHDTFRTITSHVSDTRNDDPGPSTCGTLQIILDQSSDTQRLFDHDRTSYDWHSSDYHRP